VSSISVKLDKWLYRRLRVLSRREGRPMTVLLNQAVLLFIQQRKIEQTVVKELQQKLNPEEMP
jgi:hypothetical protein